MTTQQVIIEIMYLRAYRAMKGLSYEQDFPKLTPAPEGCQRHGGNQAASGCAAIHREDEGAGVIGCEDERVKPTIEGLLILALSVACVILVMGVEW